MALKRIALKRIPLRVLTKPSLIEFGNKCFEPQRPAIVRDHLSAAEWPALATWVDVGTFRTNLLARCGSTALEELVPIEKGSSYSSADFERGHLPLGLFLSFLEQFETAAAATGSSNGDDGSSLPPPLYLAQHDLLDQLPQLALDVPCAPIWCDRFGQGDLYGRKAWLGPAGTVSTLHRDPYHNALTQLGGHKLVRLFAPKYGAALYAGAAGHQRNTCAVDAGNLDGVDRSAFPRFAAVESMIEGELLPGDALFIPKGWWHYVESLSTSFSINHWWL